MSWSQRGGCATALAPFSWSFLRAGPHLPWPESLTAQSPCPHFSLLPALPVPQLGRPRPLPPQAEEEMSGRAH